MQTERVMLSHETLVSVVGDRWSPAEVSEVASLLADGEGKFPAGTRTVAAELVKAVQRERALAAMLRATAELGYRDSCVQDVLDRAGISRPTFYEHFKNKEDCFLATFDATAERLLDRVQAASRDGGSYWRDRLALGLGALLDFFVAEPDAARTLIVETRAASPDALRRRDELLGLFTERIEAEVRDELTEPPSSIAAAGVVGGIDAVLYSRVNRGEIAELGSLLPSLMYFAVLPYGGHEAASRELATA